MLLVGNDTPLDDIISLTYSTISVLTESWTSDQGTVTNFKLLPLAQIEFKTVNTPHSSNINW